MVGNWRLIKDRPELEPFENLWISEKLTIEFQNICAAVNQVHITV